MLARLNCRGDPLVKDHGSERNTQAKWLRQCDHVRQQFLFGRWGESMKRKPLAGAPKTALDFVHDQHSPFLPRQFSRGSVEIFGNRPNTTFALNRFDQNCADVVRQLSFEIGRVIELYKIKPGYQRFKLFTILLLSGCGQRAEGPAMK